MRVLVTGATGLVGANVVRALLGKGISVRATARPASKTLALDGLDVQRVPFDLEDPASMRAAVADCDVVIHAAAAVWVGRTGREDLVRANVAGTESLCAAAQEAGCKRFVHVSSVDALGWRLDGVPADETTPPANEWLDCGYVDTKREAEAVVRRYVDRGLDAVVVNPGFMLGPWDIRPTSGRMLLEVSRGLAFFAPPGGNSFVDVRAVADGTVRAMERGEKGRGYILAGDNLTYQEAWTRMAKVVGARAPLGSLPSWVVRGVGRAGGVLGRVRGREPDVNVVSATISTLTHWFSSERAKKELGYDPGDLDTALRDAWSWFRANGYA